MTASQQAAATLAFAEMVQAQQPGAKLIGPDTGYRNWQSWLEAYLPLVAVHDGDGAPLLYGITHHVYPGIGRASYASTQALSKALDSTRAEIAWYTSTLASLAPGSQVWAGEDGPIGGGNDGTCGHNSVCGTYASALWYADDLASRAKHGFVQYQRQAFFGGAYGLTASATTHPQSALGPTEALLLRPGYWVNFLWKRILGRTVLNASSSNEAIRAYSFSGAPPSSYAARGCVAAKRQLLLLNVNPDEAAPVDFEAQKSYTMWTLSPTLNASSPSASAFSSRADLNGQLLPELINGGPAHFLGEIPVAAVNKSAKSGRGTTLLPPLAVAFICVA